MLRARWGRLSGSSAERSPEKLRPGPVGASQLQADSPPP